MNKLLFCWLLLSITGCRPADQKQEAAPPIPVAALPATKEIEYNGISYTLLNMKECSYPANDPLFEKKWNRKLLLLRMQVHCRYRSSKADVAPLGAVLTDTKGSAYETSPAVIAMAQNNQCISSGDIKAYNAIWNGTMKTGDTQTAYVLGFEIPVDVQPGKLYWNTAWKNNALFFLLTDPDMAINH